MTAQVTPPRVPDPPHPEHGFVVLDDLHRLLTRYVVLPNAESADAAVLWTAATHAQPAWEHASRLVVKSPLRRCGKTRALEVIAEIASRPLRTANISSAALVRSIDEADPPTILLDEADAIFAKRRGEAPEHAEAIRGILNAGHSRGWPYLRWDVARRGLEECATFAMAAIAAIGDLPDTVEDRAVVILMRRRAPGEAVAAFRRRDALPELHVVRDRLAAWAQEHRDELAEARPELPVEDRAADVWEPLIAIAEVAGGDWPARARRACLSLVQTADPDAGDASERLLVDLHAIFCPDPEDEPQYDRLVTGTLIERLRAIEDAPWAEWTGGRGLSARALAQLLRPYGVRPSKWSGGERGYTRASLEDAWTRYTGNPAQRATPATAHPETVTGAQISSVSDGARSSATLSATPEDLAPVADHVADDDCLPATPENPVPERGKPPAVADVADRADAHRKGATEAGERVELPW